MGAAILADRRKNIKQGLLEVNHLWIKRPEFPDQGFIAGQKQTMRLFQGIGDGGKTGK